MSRIGPVVVVVLGVTLAGCGGLVPGESDQGGTVVTTDGEATDEQQSTVVARGDEANTDRSDHEGTTPVTDSRGGLPQGISNSRVVNGSALVRTHLRAVDGTSYRSAGRVGETVDGQTNAIESRIRANESVTLAVFDASRIVNRTTFTPPVAVRRPPRRPPG